jgi:hypothetical protein
LRFNVDAVTSDLEKAGYSEVNCATPILVNDTRAKRLESEPTGTGVQVRRYAETPSAKPHALMTASLKHRVIAVGSWKLFTDAFIDQPRVDSRRLFENVLGWLTKP